MCSLYPCVQTYTTSISDNEVLKSKVRSKVMQLDMLSNDQVGVNGEHNALDNVYTTIQSPYRAQGEVYDLNRNTSAQVDITAPKESVSRQHPQFVVTVSMSLIVTYSTDLVAMLRFSISVILDGPIQMISSSQVLVRRRPYGLSMVRVIRVKRTSLPDFPTSQNGSTCLRRL
jgi:hypothetical protein